MENKKLELVLQAFEDLGVDYKHPIFQESLERVSKRAKDLSNGAMSYGEFMSILYINNIKLEVKPNPRGAKNRNKLQEMVICQVDKETGRLLRVFDNITEAAKYIATREGDITLSAAYTGVRQASIGRLKSYKGYKWYKTNRVKEFYREGNEDNEDE